MNYLMLGGLGLGALCLGAVSAIRAGRDYKQMTPEERQDYFDSLPW